MHFVYATSLPAVLPSYDYSKGKEPKREGIADLLPHYKNNFITNRVSSVKNNIFKSSTISLALFPSMQCHHKVYSSEPSCLFTASISFENWTQSIKEQAINSLIALNVPLKRITLKQIYNLLQSNQEELCHNSKVVYPAIFKAEIAYSEERKGKKRKKKTPLIKNISCRLEIHSDKKVSLLFSRNKKSGGFKEIIKAYPLGKPKDFFAYSASRLDEEQCVSQTIMQREEHFLTHYSNRLTKEGLPTPIIKVYDIFYYRIICEGAPQFQQIITMKYYPHDLIDLLTQSRLSQKFWDQNQLHYSIQLVEAVRYLHSNGVLHRDLKPENFLVDLKRKEACLIDFGLACYVNDAKERVKNVGSITYVGPEVFYEIPKETSLDIWGLACVFWVSWCKEQKFYYPWFSFANMKTPDNEAMLKQKEGMLEQMQNYDLCQPDPSLKVLFLLWNMLRYNPCNRWNIQQVYDYFKQLEKDLTRNLPEQFEWELKALQDSQACSQIK